MSDWWKNPVLQGPENDYGQYDYMIEEIPKNKTEWSRWEHQCDYCGKFHSLNLFHTQYFHTLDGWDSMDDCECWICYLKSLIRNPFQKFRTQFLKYIKLKENVRDVQKMYIDRGLAWNKTEKELWTKIFNKEI